MTHSLPNRNLKLLRCPQCETLMRVRDDGPPGSYLHCLRCKYRIQIDTAPPAQTLAPPGSAPPTVRSQFARPAPIRKTTSQLSKQVPPQPRRTHCTTPASTLDPYAQLAAVDMPLFAPLCCGAVVLAFGIGYISRHEMGPPFATLYIVLAMGTLMMSGVLRKGWRDYWGFSALGCVFVETLGIARLITSDHPGEHHYGFLIMILLIAPVLFFSRNDGRSSSTSGSWSSCSSCGGGGCGGGGCGGGGCGG